MPYAFDKCRREGGRIRTKSLGKGKYIHVCYKDGKSYAGEVHYKIKTKKKK
jgi:hypothetical protein